jgi:hypothetical protein
MRPGKLTKGFAYNKTWLLSALVETLNNRPRRKAGRDRVRPAGLFECSYNEQALKAGTIKANNFLFCYLIYVSISSEIAAVVSRAWLQLSVPVQLAP